MRSIFKQGIIPMTHHLVFQTHRGSQPTGSLTIEQPTIDVVPRPPKGILSKSKHNPNVRETQNYRIVEDLAQAPCAMLSLEVLQFFPNQ